MPLFQLSVVFLGHVLSADGISANLEKVDTVKNWPVPKSYTHLLALNLIMGTSSQILSFDTASSQLSLSSQYQKEEFKENQLSK